jgi:hypothetical protein
MPIVAEQHTFVIGVDTNAATHSLSLVNASTWSEYAVKCSAGRGRSSISQCFQTRRQDSTAH